MREEEQIAQFLEAMLTPCSATQGFCQRVRRDNTCTGCRCVHLIDAMLDLQGRHGVSTTSPL